jgi:hypothetical protein
MFTTLQVHLRLHAWSMFLLRCCVAVLEAMPSCLMLSLFSPPRVVAGPAV